MIVEEEEEPEEEPKEDHPSDFGDKDANLHLSKPSIFTTINPSVQTFETAKSHESELESDNSTQTFTNSSPKNSFKPSDSLSDNEDIPSKTYVQHMDQNIPTNHQVKHPETLKNPSFEPDMSLSEENFDSGARLAQPISFNKPGNIVKVPVVSESQQVNSKSPAPGGRFGGDATGEMCESHVESKQEQRNSVSGEEQSTKPHQGRKSSKHSRSGKKKSKSMIDVIDQNGEIADEENGSNGSKRSKVKGSRKSSHRDGSRDKEAPRERGREKRKRSQPRGMTNESESEVTTLTRKHSIESVRSKRTHSFGTRDRLRDPSRSKDPLSVYNNSTVGNEDDAPPPLPQIDTSILVKAGLSPSQKSSKNATDQPNGSSKSNIKKTRTYSISSMSMSMSIGTQESLKQDKPSKVRSFTLGDISKYNDASYDKSGKKKFSFRSLFKLKSKIAVGDDIDPTIPPKVPSKSYSSPNIAQFNNNNMQPSSVSQTSGKKDKNDASSNTFKKTKSTDNITNFFSNSLTKVKSRTGLNKEKNSRAVDDSKTEKLSKVEPALPPVPTKILQEAITNVNALAQTPKIEQENAVISKHEPRSVEVSSSQLTGESFLEPSKLKNESSKVKPGVIDDDDDNDENIEPDLSDLDSIAEYEYDSKNLEVNPPTKLSNTRYDEEIKLSPYQPDFGSPFTVSYSGPSESPKKPGVTAVRLSQITSGPAMGPTSPGSKRSTSKGDDKSTLAGDALFPKSLSAQEVESIVSLERSRSMRSIISNKRSSYANYNGSDENVIQFNGPPPLSPTPTVQRSGSILKSSSSRRGLNHELTNKSFTKSPSSRSITVPSKQTTTPTITPTTTPITKPSTSKDETIDDSIKQNYSMLKTMENDSDDSSFRDLIEFSDFIDVDQLSLLKSPSQTSESPKWNSPIHEPSLTHEQSPPQSPIAVDDNHEPLENMHATLSSAFTLNLETIDPAKVPSPQFAQESFDKTTPRSPTTSTTSATNATPATPATPTTPASASVETPVSPSTVQIREPGYNVLANRPMSMSFRGLKNGGILTSRAQHNLRSSESHQSFNISIDDDSDYSDTGVGGGFGSSGEEDNDLHLQSNYEVSSDSERGEKKLTTKESHEKMLNSLTRPPNRTFVHDKIPSISSHNSSPRSFSSMISRKWKKSPQPPSLSAPTATNSVRFSSRIILYDTYDGDEYDRHPETATCNQLTPLLAQQIKAELNTFKSEMEIHSDSQCYTHFF